MASNGKNPPVGVAKLFRDVPLDAVFCDGIFTGSGAQAGVKSWKLWRKIAPAKGECIEQHGYGNTRGLGNWQGFGQACTVFQVEE